jgi:hypothetical protein
LKKIGAAHLSLRCYEKNLLTFADVASPKGRLIERALPNSYRDFAKHMLNVVGLLLVMEALKISDYLILWLFSYLVCIAETYYLSGVLFFIVGYLRAWKDCVRGRVVHHPHGKANHFILSVSEFTWRYLWHNSLSFTSQSAIRRQFCC